MKQKYRSPLNVLSFILGLGLLILLLFQVDFHSLLGLLSGIQPGYLLFAGVVYLIKSVVRAVRFWRINRQIKPSFLKMLRLTLASSLASQLMPLKLGELAYIYLVKREFRVSVAQGVSALMAVRIYDMLAISLLFLAACIGFGLSSETGVYFYYVLAFVGFLMVLLSIVIFAGNTLLNIMHMVIERTFIGRWPFLVRMEKGIEEILHNIRRHQGKENIALIVLPALEWSVNFLMYHILLIGMGLAPHILDTVTGVAFAALASILPINSFGNFGTQEAGWATGMILAGYSQETALASGFATHLLSLGFMVVLGGISWLLYLFDSLQQKKVVQTEL